MDDELLFILIACQKGYTKPAQIAELATSKAKDGTDPLSDQLFRKGIISESHYHMVKKIVADSLRTYGLRFKKTIMDTPRSRIAVASYIVDVEDTSPTRVEHIAGKVSKTTKKLTRSHTEHPMLNVTRQQLERYVIEEGGEEYSEIGRGGTSRILKVLDKHLGREIALKELLPGSVDFSELMSRMDTKDSRSAQNSLLTSLPVVRFLREARVTGQLEHPNIVPVYELGKREDGSLYYTMKLVKGNTLSKVLRKCKTLKDRLNLLSHYQDICHAMAYAHSRGVIHRDLKPNNIMLGEFGETIVLDWGIAKLKGMSLVDDAPSDPDFKILEEMDIAKTDPGTAVGTPAYMSPEQADGKIDEVDERSDVWALGAILYRILTGNPPFTGKSQYEILKKVRKDPIIPPIQVDEQIPPELSAICDKALSKNKAARYQSAKELATDVEAYISGSNVRAYEYSSWELIKRFAAKNKIIITAATIISIVVMVALVSVSISYQSEKQARKNEEVAWAKEHQQYLMSNYRIAHAFNEKADRLFKEKIYLSSQIYAAASLLHNPTNPKSPYFNANQIELFPGGLLLRVKANSKLYLTRFLNFIKFEKDLMLSSYAEGIDISPDGQLLASGHWDKSINIWDMNSLTLIKTLKGHQDWVHRIKFSPDGKYLISVSSDNSARIWDIHTGETITVLKGHEDSILGLAISPDGQLIATASRDHTIKIWNLKEGQEQSTLIGHTDEVMNIDFSPDNSLLASAGNDKTVRIWDVSEVKALHVLKLHEGSVRDVDFSPDGNILASASFDNVIILWDVSKGTPISVLKGHKDHVNDVEFSRNGQLLASASSDKTIRIWDGKKGNLLITLEGHWDSVRSVVFSEGLLASSSWDSRIRLWKFEEHKVFTHLDGHDDLITDLILSKDDRWLISASFDKTAKIWDLKQGGSKFTLKGHKKPIVNVALSENGKWLVTGSRDKTIKLWDAVTGELINTFSEHFGAVLGVAFSPDSRLIASGSRDKTIRIWDVESGKQLKVLDKHTDSVWRIAFLPDNKRLVSTSSDGTIKVWNIESGKVEKSLQGHTDWITCVAFSSDGKWMASSGKDAQIILWNVHDWTLHAKLVGHRQWVKQVKFSPNNQLIASSSDDRTIILWSLDRKEPLFTIQTLTAAIGIDFSSDSKILAVGDGKRIYLYPILFSEMLQDPLTLLKKSGGRRRFETRWLFINII